MIRYRMTDELGKVTFEQGQDELYQQLSVSSGVQRATWIKEIINDYQIQFSSTNLNYISKLLLDVSKEFPKKYIIVSFAERNQAALPSAYGLLPIGHWLQPSLAKVYLITRVISSCIPYEDRFSVLYQLYDASDTDGRVACLRALNYIDGLVSDGLTIIHDAGRTYLSELLEAAWCHHPFSSRYLTTEELRKAVMKSLFCDVSIEGFMHIDHIADQELSRRLCEFANEREAAERTVPQSVWRIAAYHPVPGLIARLIGHLEHPKQEERLTAAICLNRAQNVLALPFLQDRLAREDDVDVQKSLVKAIEHLEDGEACTSQL